MILEQIRISKNDADNINVMKQMAGWKAVRDMVVLSIDMKNAELINFNWELDDKTDPTKMSVLKFKDLQKETELLKQFLLFVDKPAIIQSKNSTEVYE